MYCPNIHGRWLLAKKTIPSFLSNKFVSCRKTIDLQCTHYNKQYRKPIV